MVGGSADLPAGCSELTVAAALRSSCDRAAATDAAIRSTALDQLSDPSGWADGHDPLWVLLHLINETARPAGHADATRELLDGHTGEQREVLMRGTWAAQRQLPCCSQIAIVWATVACACASARSVGLSWSEASAAFFSAALARSRWWTKSFDVYEVGMT